MEWINTHLQLLFLICLGIFLFSFVVMNRIAKNFITLPPDQKKFSIFRLEFPGSSAQLSKLILQMPATTKQAVRAHLYVDFFFMLGAYPGIAILCYKTSLILATTHKEASIFLLLMVGFQLVAFACDIIENIMLLRKLANINSWSEHSHQRFSKIVFYKFMIALFGVATVICSLLYLWFINLIPLRYVQGVSIIIGLIILLITIKALIDRYKRRKKEKAELLLARQIIGA